MSACRRCGNHKALVGRARGDLARLARMLARQDDPTRNRYLYDELTKAKAELAAKLEASDYHQRTEH